MDKINKSNSKRKSRKRNTLYTKLYFNNLINKYSPEDIIKHLHCSKSSLYRYINGESYPQKEIVSKLIPLVNKSYDEIKLELYGSTTNLPPKINYPNIREIIASTAFSHDQRDDILFSKTITKTEKYLIGYLFLIQKGVKALYNQSSCEVINDYIISESLDFYENNASLIKDFNDLLGLWFLNDNYYYFSKTPSNNPKGVFFTDNIEYYFELKKVQQIQNKNSTNFNDNLLLEISKKLDSYFKKNISTS